MIGTSLQHLQVAVYICDLVIATVAICCRLWARRMKGTRWQINDYLMVVAYLAVLVMLSIALSMVTHGELGVHRMDIEPERYRSVARYVGQANFILSTIMMLATNMVKMSITEFYLHLFPQGWLHHICHVQLVGLTLFMIAQITADLTICQPMAAAYDFSIDGKCGDVVTFWLSISLIALFFDVTCVLLPMPIFWTLRLDQKKKWRLTVLFGLGFCICGLTGLRVWVYRQLDYTDPTFGYAHGILLTVTEPALGILAGCIPIMSPCLLILSRRVRSNIPLTKTANSSKPSKEVSVGGSGKANPFQRLEDHMYPLTDVKVSHSHDTRGSSTEALTEEVVGLSGLGGIKVQREIMVDSRSDDGFDGDSPRTKL